MGARISVGKVPRGGGAGFGTLLDGTGALGNVVLQFGSEEPPDRGVCGSRAGELPVRLERAGELFLPIAIPPSKSPPVLLPPRLLSTVFNGRIQ